MLLYRSLAIKLEKKHVDVIKKRRFSVNFMVICDILFRDDCDDFDFLSKLFPLFPCLRSKIYLNVDFESITRLKKKD